MEIITEIKDVSDHLNNINHIEKEIKLLLGGKYRVCDCFIRHIIITDNLEKTISKYGYNTLNRFARGTTVRTHKSMYDIVINYYNNCFRSFDNGWVLNADIKNTLCHEFQHVKDHKEYDDYIDSYVKENQVSDNSERIARNFFYEFNAAYHAQMYFQVMWENNYYWIDTNTKKYHDKIREIKDVINKFDIKDISKAKRKADRLAQLMINFTNDLIYDFAISFGTNAGDNMINYGRKEITIEIGGIDKDIDAVLNNYIAKINYVINDNKDIIQYSFKHCMDIFECINEIFKHKIAALRQ